MRHDAWVIGPIAWDTILLVPHLPKSGGFVQAAPAVERPGGAGANVAVALASAGVRVRMIGYVGRDAFGETLLAQLTDSGVDTGHVRGDHPHTSHVQIFVESSGERTIIGLVPDTLEDVPIPADAICAGDLVYVAGWRTRFEDALRTLAERDVTVVTVPPEEPWSGVDASFVLGSSEQFGGVDPATDPRYRQALAGRTRAAVMTRGAAGVRIYEASGHRDRPARPAVVVDATGAGDAFAAGFLLRLERGLEAAVDAGLAWGARAVAVAQSQPPPWPDVAADLTSWPPAANGRRVR
jgi:sugar/nucleoside kinase (ribokinase family)